MTVVNKETGFTLVEMIGVLAVIAILASVAAPRIIDSIEDAKVSKYVQQVKTLESAVAKFYADTTRWPDYNSKANPSSEPHKNQLMINALNASGDKIPGWQGPYLAKMPSNPFAKEAYRAIYHTSDSQWTCDLDGDGETDGRFVLYRTDDTGAKAAEKISNIFDEDGGTDAWKSKGRVKVYRGTETHILVYCITQT